MHSSSCSPNMLLWSLQAYSRLDHHSSASCIFIPSSALNSFKLTWPHLLSMGNGDTVHGFVRTEIYSRVFGPGHLPPYGSGLCSRLPHQKGMSPCKDRNNLALKECPSHLWTLVLQKRTQEKHRSEKPRSALPLWLKRGNSHFGFTGKQSVQQLVRLQCGLHPRRLPYHLTGQVICKAILQ